MGVVAASEPYDVSLYLDSNRVTRVLIVACPILSDIVLDPREHFLAFSLGGTVSTALVLVSVRVLWCPWDVVRVHICLAIRALVDSVQWVKQVACH